MRSGYVERRQGHFPLRSLLIALMILASGALTFAAEKPRQEVLVPLVDMASRSLARLKSADLVGARSVFKTFESLWSPVEDSVRAGDPVVYARIEVAATRAEAAMEADPPEAERAAAALAELGQAAGEYGKAQAGSASAPTGSVDSLGTILAQVRDSLATGHYDQAGDLMESFVGLWPVVETGVKSRSPEIYARLEAEMTRASSLIMSGPGSRAPAMDVLAVMLGQIEEIRASAGYTAWDAGFILLREGMEALLVLAALLAMLKKSPAGQCPAVGLGRGRIRAAPERRACAPPRAGDLYRRGGEHPGGPGGGRRACLRHPDDDRRGLAASQGKPEGVVRLHGKKGQQGHRRREHLGLFFTCAPCRAPRGRGNRRPAHRDRVRHRSGAAPCRGRRCPCCSWS